MIAFKEDIELTVVDGYDEETHNITSETQKIFKAGEKVDADIFYENDTDTDTNTNTDYVDLLFGNGNIAHTIQRECFDIIS